VDASNLEQFRVDVRAFVREHAPAYRQRSGVRSPESRTELDDLQRWTRELFSAGLIGADWPLEYGGTHDHDVLRDVIVAEELARSEAPPPAGGSVLAAQALIGFGTDEQRERHLPRIRSGEELWCQLFSEPEAGSDLASLRTRATREGDEYVVTGQKVWTTNGQWADFGYLLARTDREAPKHKGISAFVLDMRTPGISVRPLREITGTADFNEVFLDEVRLPKESLIGHEGQGWLIANTTLAHERAAVGASVVMLAEAWNRLWSSLQPGGALAEAGSRVDVRQEMGHLYAAIDALGHLASDVLARWKDGRELADDGPIVKLLFSELNLRLVQLAVDLQGPRGMLVEGDPGSLDEGRWQDALLYARAYTIAGGSSEIMRNVIAERGLGLPR
jgi:alkylation response protein AidB-like acyl-CoA dehydrogenase